MLDYRLVFGVISAASFSDRRHVGDEGKKIDGDDRGIAGEQRLGCSTQKCRTDPAGHADGEEGCQEQAENGWT